MTKSYPRLSPGGLRGLSIFNIFLWALTTVVTVCIVVRYTNLGIPNISTNQSYPILHTSNSPTEMTITYDVIGDLDYVFAGIWTGAFYGIAGVVGICGSYERKRSQLLTVVIFNSLSLVGASVTGCIAGIIGFHIIKQKETVCYPSGPFVGYAYDNSYTDCMIWLSLECTLLCLCVIAGIINLSCLIVTLVGLCGPRKRNGLVRMEVGNPSFDFKKRPSA